MANCPSCVQNSSCHGNQKKYFKILLLLSCLADFQIILYKCSWMTLSQVTFSFKSTNIIWLFIDKVHFLFYGPGHHWGDIWFLIIHIFCCINLWQNALYSISNAYKREKEIFFRKKRSFVFLLKNILQMYPL